MFGDPSRVGRCYELAGKFLMDRFLSAGPFGDDSSVEGYRLVHGSVITLAYGVDPDTFQPRRIGHAWVLGPDGRVWEPIRDEWIDKARWYGIVQADEEATYDWDSTRRHMLDTGVFGPWHDTSHHYTGSRRHAGV